ncbi:MAG: alpha/beta hydrolase [Phycisphaerae bacterium]|nr:alpha/beta hydrolase [Phycisphaerae bacterium]
MQSSASRPDGRMIYKVEGAGPAILFIQGVGMHATSWRPQIDAFRASHCCVTFEHRGLGGSDAAVGRVSIEGMADDALAVLNAAGVDAVHVVGHSLGGVVAQQLALSHRVRVRSLSLLCTFPAGRRAAPLSWRMIWLGLRSQVGTRAMRRRGFLRLVMPPGRIENEAELAARLAELFGHDLGEQPKVVPAQLRALRRSDLCARLPELAGLPTLVVSAFHDPIAPPALGRELAKRIAGARYVEVGDASHGMPISHAGVVNGALAAHLADAS